MPQELSIGQIKFKAFDLGGHEIARKVWKDYYAKVSNTSICRIAVTGPQKSGSAGCGRHTTCILRRVFASAQRRLRELPIIGVSTIMASHLYW